MSAPATSNATASVPDRDVWTWIGLAVVGAAAAVMSFTALADLARLAGITNEVGPVAVRWLLPIAVDVLAAVGTRVWLRRQASPEAVTYARWTAWTAIGTTVTGNAAHGYFVQAGTPPPWWAAVAVSAIPAVALGGLVHLAVLVGRGCDRSPADRSLGLGPVTGLNETAGTAGGPVTGPAVNSDDPSQCASIDETAGLFGNPDVVPDGLKEQIDSILDRRIGPVPVIAVTAVRPVTAVPDTGHDLDRRRDRSGPSAGHVGADSTDVELIDHLQEWALTLGQVPGRKVVMARYGVGAGRADRLRTAVTASAELMEVAR